MFKQDDDDTIRLWDYDNFYVTVRPAKMQGWVYTVTVRNPSVQLHNNPDVAYVTAYAARYYGIRHYEKAMRDRDQD